MGKKNLRRLFAGITTVVMVVLLVSCKSGDKPKDEPEAYFNGAYGISVSVPENWLIASINKTNMTESPEKSDDPEAMDIMPYEDSGSGIQLIELWSGPDSADKEHAALMVYIELYSDVDKDSYLSAFEEAYSGDFNGYFSTLTAKKETLLGGKEYTLLQFITQLPESVDEYFEEYYISQLEEEKFLVICTTYWADSELSQQNAVSALELVTVE